MTKTPTRARGFTLIELMITLGIAGILLGLAAPGMREFILNNQAATRINDLNTALSFARSEAIKANDNVTVCSSAAPFSSCHNEKNNFHHGYIVFIDSDFDGVVDGGETVLRVQGALPGSDKLVFDKDRVTYRSNGLATTGFEGTFELCDGRGTTEAKGLVIGPSGRPRLATDSDANGILEDYAGTDLQC